MSLIFTYQGQKISGDELKEKLPISDEYKAYQKKLRDLEWEIHNLKERIEDLEVEREELLQEWGEDS
jgi:predicted nuclease with TOPRIM domain